MDKCLAFFGLKTFPEFSDPRDFLAALTAYENACLLNLVRGYTKTAYDLLLIGRAALDHYQDRFGEFTSHIGNRCDSVHSLLHLCNGDRVLAEKSFSQASKCMQRDEDPFTAGFYYLISSFHVSAVGGVTQAYAHAVDASNQFRMAQDMFMVCISMIFAGWQAFMCGNIERAKNSYSTAFDYGLRTANRPVIKLSLELFAILRIMAGDYKGAGAILDQIKSTQHSTHSNSHRKRKPNSFKCALIAFSYVRERRFKDSVPFIQYAAKQLCEMKTYNSVCAMFLFFTAYAALECIENGMSVSVTFMKILSASLKSNIDKCMESLSKLAVSLPCLLPLYHACSIKRVMIDEAKIDEKTLAEVDDELRRVLIIPTHCSGDLKVPSLDSAEASETKDSGSGSHLFTTESNIIETTHMKVLSERASPTANRGRRKSSFMDDASQCAPPDVGFFDDFSFAMLFLHMERHKLHLKAGKVSSPYGGKGDSGRVSEFLKLVYAEQNPVEMFRPETNKIKIFSKQPTGRLDNQQSSKYFGDDDSPVDEIPFSSLPDRSATEASGRPKVGKTAPFNNMSVEENLALLGSIEDEEDDDPGLPGAVLSRNMSLYFAPDETADVIHSPQKPKPTLMKILRNKLSIFSSHRDDRVHPAAPLTRKPSAGSSGVAEPRSASVKKSLLT